VDHGTMDDHGILPNSASVITPPSVITDLTRVIIRPNYRDHGNFMIPEGTRRTTTRSNYRDHGSGYFSSSTSQ
jgi:zona occludens toxin (predicted ATPase)